MNKPHWLNRALLVTTALVAPTMAQAQDTETETSQTATASQDEAVLEDNAPEISAPGEIIVTGRRDPNTVRNADQVLSVLSTEDIARTGEGDIAGALSRVTGMSIVGNGLVYVRGLGDRYSLALLNGLPLPSPEPLKRVVPLDLFPTNVVASSLVQKSYSANYPGEFGGGVINLTTIAVPDESFFSVSTGVSGDTETTGHFGYSYYGSGTDWSGFDNGARDPGEAIQGYFDGGTRLSNLPDDNLIIAELVRPYFAVVQKLNPMPVNFSASLTGGTAFDAGDARIGVVATASYNNENLTRDIIQQSPALADLTLLDNDYRTVATANHITVNGLLALGAELGDHKLRWTNLYIRDTVKETRMTEGDNIDNDTSRIIQNTAWYERQLIDSQLVAELRFGEIGFDLRAGYANSQREAPFETEFQYVRTNRANDPYGEYYLNLLDGGQNGSANVAFSDLNEDLWYGGVDVSGLITDYLTGTAGYAYTDTSRTTSRRDFSIRAPSSLPRYVGLFRPDKLVQAVNINYFDYNLIETTETDPAFDAGLVIHAGYGKLNWEPTDTISIDAGVRFEKATQTVTPVQVFDEQLGSFRGNELQNEYWLPGGTITWEATPELQIRANASQTIARPQFRELVPQLYYDPESNRSYRGNEKLVDSKLTNAELRAEYYFTGEERVTLAGFWKEIDKPIETYISFGDNGTLGLFANAPKAQLYGSEFELVKYLDLYDMGGFFGSRRLATILNYTYTKSELKVGPDDTTLVYSSPIPRPASFYFKDGAPLTGQSDHVANLQLSLEDQDNLSQQTLLLNYASKRVVGRGDSQLPDVIEDPGFTLDFVARQGVKMFGLSTEWKFEVRNILGQNHEEYQATHSERIEVNTYDVGRKISLSVSADF